MPKPPEHVDDWRGDVQLLYPSRYLKTADLQDRDVTVTIRRIEKGHKLTMAGGVTDRKPVIHLVESEKMLVLNKTNARHIAAMYGNKCADWIGNRITLYPCQGPNADELLKAGQAGIRVREQKPAPKPTTNGNGDAPAPGLKPSQMNEPPADWVPDEAAADTLPGIDQ